MIRQLLLDADASGYYSAIIWAVVRGVGLPYRWFSGAESARGAGLDAFYRQGGATRENRGLRTGADLAHKCVSDEGDWMTHPARPAWFAARHENTETGGKA